MEKGISLQKIINQRAQQNALKKNYFSKHQLYCLFEGILKAGQQLDKEQCSHRDIKPDNFLFIPKDFTVKICDLGEAISYSNCNTITLDNCRTINAVGTEAFMSPEMLELYRNKQMPMLVRHQIEFYKRSDIYSYGLVFLHLITLATPKENPYIFVMNNYTNKNNKENVDNYTKSMQELHRVIKEQGYDFQLFIMIKEMLNENNEKRTKSISEYFEEFCNFIIQKQQSPSLSNNEADLLRQSQLQLDLITSRIIDINPKNQQTDLDSSLFDFNLKNFKQKVIKTFQEHSSGIWDLVQLNDKQFASCSFDRSIKIWDINKENSEKTFQAEGELGRIMVKFQQDLLLCGQDSPPSILCYNWKENRQIKEWRGHQGTINCIIKIKNIKLEEDEQDKQLLQRQQQQQFLTCSDDGTVKQWQFDKENCICSWQAHEKKVFSILLLSQDYVLSFGDDKFIKLWQINTQLCIQQIQTEYCLQRSLLINENSLAVSTNQGKILCFSLPKLSLLFTLTGHAKKDIWKLIKLNQDHILSCSNDQTMIIWNTTKQQQILQLTSHQASIFTCLNFNNQKLISGSSDNTIKIWE